MSRRPPESSFGRFPTLDEGTGKVEPEYRFFFVMSQFAVSSYRLFISKNTFEKSKSRCKTPLLALTNAAV